MIKKHAINLLYWIAMIGIAGYIGYVKGWLFADFDSISPKEASVLLQSEHNITLLDVRTQAEYTQEHIKGSILIPIQILSQDISQLKAKKGDKIIVYCHSGSRSIAASRILAENGYIPLNMTGGISEWKKEGLSITH